MEYTGDEVDLELEGVRELRVHTVAGEVSVTAVPGPTRVEGEVRSRPPLEVTFEGGVLTIVHREERMFGIVTRAIDCVLAVTVPPGTPVVVAAVSADVLVAGTGPSTEAATVSGRLTVSRLRGTITARTVSGDIDAQDLEGELHTNVVSGSLTVAGGRLSRVTAKSVSGDLTLDLEGGLDGDLTTVSGDVAVRLPEGSGLSVDATTMSGHLDSAFELADAVTSRRRLRGSVGDARARLTVRTTSGDFALLRRDLASSALEQR